MQPYRVIGGVEIFQADALDLLRSLPDASVQLVATDPPYFRVKGEAWDRAWKSDGEFLRWVGHLCREWRRVLAPNGSLYVFASPDMAHGVERVIRRHFNVLNVVRWEKEQGWHQKAEKEALRSFLSPWESCVFAEQFGSDGSALRGSGYAAECQKLHAGVFEPLRAYLSTERDRAGLSNRDVDKHLGTNGMAGHYFGASQWALPTSEVYASLRELFNSQGGEYLRRDYEDLRRDYEYLRRDYEDLRRDYEDLRRPFYAGDTAQWSDLWRFPTVAPYPGKHPCEKPLAMMEHIIRTSSRPGDLVLDTFAGSGATAEAARNLGRRAIVGDADPHWCHWTAQRLSQETLFVEAA